MAPEAETGRWCVSLGKPLFESELSMKFVGYFRNTGRSTLEFLNPFGEMQKKKNVFRIGQDLMSQTPGLPGA